MLVAFLHYSFRFFRWLRAWLAGVCSAPLFSVPALFAFWCVGLVCLLFVPWWLVAVCLRRLFFVRFARPWAPSWRSRLFVPGLGGACRWACVPASALASVVALGGVWARPAVVARRSGLVLFFWVWLPRGFGVAETETETEAVTETETAIVFANAKTIAKTLLKRKFELAI